MSKPLLSTAPAASAPAERGFFLPDLCQVRAVLFLVLVAELLALVLEMARAGVAGFDWYAFALRSLFLQWVMLASAAGLCWLRPLLQRRALALAAALCYLLIIAVELLLNLLAQWWLQGGLAAREPVRFDLPALAGNALICAVLAGIALRYFYLSQQLREQSQAELQARIQALQSRIRPHFLFNSMNSIASLIDSDPRAAETAVEDLCALFRASLEVAGAEVSLADELALCRRYARIEQWRLGERLRIEWQLESLPGHLPIPSLALQPLLENAIYHGIQRRADGGTVVLSGQWTDGWLRLSVCNPLAAASASEELAPRAGNQLALDNIRHRLRALYGERADVSVSQRDGQYCATLSYPCAESRQ